MNDENTELTLNLGKGPFGILYPFILYLSAGLILEHYTNYLSSKFISYMIIICYILTVLIMEHKFKSTYQLNAVFSDSEVLLKKRSGHTRIKYDQIKYIQKLLTINGGFSRQGYYRIKIKTRLRWIYLYSTESDCSHHLTFEETEFYKLYQEFQKHGVICR